MSERQETKARARSLRRRLTGAERYTWHLLRNRRILGLKFRRQHPVCGYIADFFCHELNLILEIDGSIHRTPDQQAYDRERAAVLTGAGFHILRVPNLDVSHRTLTEMIRPLLEKCLEKADNNCEPPQTRESRATRHRSTGPESHVIDPSL